MEETKIRDNCPEILASKTVDKPSHATFAVTINGVSIDIVINNYKDRYFIIVTQFKKFGTLVSVEKDTAHSEGESKIVYSTKVLLGSDNDTVHAAARFLVEQLGLDKPLLISFGLKDISPSVVKDLCNLLKTHI